MREPGRETGLKDVARRAGVSVGTVSNVLNHPGKVSAETAERVQVAIDELGWVRNDAARQLRQGRNGMLGPGRPRRRQPVLHRRRLRRRARRHRARPRRAADQQRGGHRPGGARAADVRVAAARGAARGAGRRRRGQARGRPRPRHPRRAHRPARLDAGLLLRRRRRPARRPDRCRAPARGGSPPDRLRRRVHRHRAGGEPAGRRAVGRRCPRAAAAYGSTPSRPRR